MERRIVYRKAKFPINSMSAARPSIVPDEREKEKKRPAEVPGTVHVTRFVPAPPDRGRLAVAADVGDSDADPEYFSACSRAILSAASGICVPPGDDACGIIVADLVC